MKTHFACAVIYRASPANGELEFLVFDYHSTNPRTGVRTLKQVKFPGGVNRRYPDESVAMTLAREVWEETHLALVKSKEIWRKEMAADHIKYGFLVNFDDCRGEPRRLPIVDDDGNELGSPRWAPASILGRSLYYSHQEVYLVACRELRIF